MIPYVYDVQAECSGNVAHGSYQLVNLSGVVEVSGAHSGGVRNGVFTVRRSTGEKVAELPYVNGLFSGTVELWYGPEYGTERPKLSSAYRGGKLHGLTQGWYPSGQLLEKSTYRDGRLTDTEMYTAEGSPVAFHVATSRQASRRDSDRVYYRTLEEVFGENPPRCPDP